MSSFPTSVFRLALSLLICLSACASTTHTRPPTGTPFPSSVRAPSPTTPHRTRPDETLPFPGSQDSADLQKLVSLWQKRTQQGAVVDYPIGPGDVLEISVPDIEELENRTVRVSGEGTIALPFVGTVQAAGVPENKLREEIRHRLEKDYIHDPQVNLFVREYRSRQVAVIGAVEKPGLYSLTSKADTLFDMITLAGGITQGAAPHIHFIPAEPIEENGKVHELASALSVQLISKDSSTSLLKQVDLILIDLQSLATAGSQIYLNLPVRPGDIIMVPGSGEVLVQGWVQKPGSYKITPGLTVLGVVAAAGGQLFAANTNAVRIIRTGRQGERISFLANLEDIKQGQKPDISVQEGDIIEVASSVPKLVPYGLYRFFSTAFHIGGERTPLLKAVNVCKNRPLILSGLLPFLIERKQQS